MGRTTPLARGRMQPLDSTPTCATPPGLAAWWPGGGDDAFDAMGSNPDTLQNGALASYAAMVGDGFGFDGISQAIEIPHSTTLVTPNYSVEAWIYPSAQVEDPTGQALIFGQCNGRALMVVRPGASGLTAAFSFAADPYNSYEVASDGEIPIGDWTHLVGTWDGATLSLYINGVLNAQGSPSGAAP